MGYPQVLGIVRCGSIVESCRQDRDELAFLAVRSLGCFRPIAGGRIGLIVSGQEAFIRIESLSSWSDGGQRHAFQRDTFYARLIPPQMARAEITQSTYNGGG